MKKLLLTLTFLFTSVLSFGETSVLGQDEIGILQELIESTKQNLHTQQRLLRQLIDYKQARSAFLSDPSSAKYATDLVKNAMKVHQEIKKDNFTHLFSINFLTELNFYNQVGEEHHIVVKIEN